MYYHEEFKPPSHWEANRNEFEQKQNHWMDANREIHSCWNQLMLWSILISNFRHRNSNLQGWRAVALCYHRISLSMLHTIWSNSKRKRNQRWWLIDIQWSKKRPAETWWDGRITMLPWMLLKIELWTQPRLSLEEEKTLRALIRSSTTTTIGLKTKMLISKFLLLKGTKHGILISSFSLLQFPTFVSQKVGYEWKKS